ncbi:hypothetical protein Cni_G26486 [Canna indica]|uniref:Uncharacterized protein n=1 Tax=Canna indica TaxID=4628 RepID=A0AAQ3L343_9LILI|nr:hypothetical protein Cni_G26486 [Canna indica]
MSEQCRSFTARLMVPPTSAFQFLIVLAIGVQQKWNAEVLWMLKLSWQGCIVMRKHALGKIRLSVLFLILSFFLWMCNRINIFDAVSFGCAIHSYIYSWRASPVVAIAKNLMGYHHGL